MIYTSKKRPEERRQLLGQIFSSLTLNGKTLGYEYTPTAEAIAKVANESNELIKTFELQNNPSGKDKTAAHDALKTIWLGVVAEVRTLIMSSLAAR